jgi:hypothetical protein
MPALLRQEITCPANQSARGAQTCSYKTYREKIGRVYGSLAVSPSSSNCDVVTQLSPMDASPDIA